MSNNYPNLRKYLQTEFDAGQLSVVAGKAKLPITMLHDIVYGAQMTSQCAAALALITEPKDDQWQVDDDECDPLAVVELTDDEIRERLQFADDNGKLNMIAETSGVKGGVKILRGILSVGEGTIDPVTRSLLIAIME